MPTRNSSEIEPLKNPKFRSAGIMDKLREIFLGSERPLETLQIEVTSHCFGKCAYCPHTTMNARWHSRHMSAEVMASLWPLLRNSARAHLQGWGEPLLHPLFPDFVEFARKAGCQTSTTSCGINISADLIDRLIDSGLDVIAFSLAGTDISSNSPRGNGNFDEVCSTIQQLKQKIAQNGKGPEIHLAYLLLADRIEAVAKLPELMEKLDVKCAVVSTLDYLPEPEQAYLAFQPDESEKIAKARALLETAAKEASLQERLLIYGLPDPLTECANGCRENISNSLYVNAEGQISPCIYLNVPAEKTDAKNLVYGNSLEENVWTIWKKPEYREFRQRLAAGEAPPYCISCPKRKESLSL